MEQAALAWLEGLNWRVMYGPDIAPAAPNAERDSYDQVVLEQRLTDAIDRLNPDLPYQAREDVLRKLTRPEGATLETRNRSFHRMLVDGVTVEYRDKDGSIRGDQAKVVDFDNPWNNDWLAVNQFTVTENGHERRPDIVLFVNGLPLGVIELKNPADPDATVNSAWNQLQTYKSELPTLFSMNEAMIVSDGNDARMGTLTAGMEWFKPWRTISGESAGRPPHAGATGAPRRRVRSRSLPRAGTGLHRVRGRRRPAGQEDGWLPPVSRRPRRSGRDAARRLSCSRRTMSRNSVDATSPAANRVALPVTGELVWSGTLRARARA